MLIAMTFNIGLLGAIVLGLSASYFVFGLQCPEKEETRVSEIGRMAGGVAVGYVVARSDEPSKHDRDSIN